MPPPEGRRRSGPPPPLVSADVVSPDPRHGPSESCRLAVPSPIAPEVGLPGVPSSAIGLEYEPLRRPREVHSLLSGSTPGGSKLANRLGDAVGQEHPQHSLLEPAAGDPAPALRSVRSRRMAAVPRSPLRPTRSRQRRSSPGVTSREVTASSYTFSKRSKETLPAMSSMVRAGCVTGMASRRPRSAPAGLAEQWTRASFVVPYRLESIVTSARPRPKPARPCNAAAALCDTTAPGPAASVAAIRARCHVAPTARRA